MLRDFFVMVFSCFCQRTHKENGAKNSVKFMLVKSIARSRSVGCVVMSFMHLIHRC